MGFIETPTACHSICRKYEESVAGSHCFCLSFTLLRILCMHRSGLDKPWKGDHSIEIKYIIRDRLKLKQKQWNPATDFSYLRQIEHKLWQAFCHDVDEEYIPKAGMTFPSLEVAAAFYKEYTKRAEFSILK
ncbi:hypothetical protein PIB30_092895 [Stylosanthes scabra]|uniref:Uncharacterized protein n=1 Tax=Stylosanthes scabra TaxID=79078 RepID=A0ABU6ZUA5_9FABA|nr:hypothetical protein [Stylosanthes scabra]